MKSLGIILYAPGFLFMFPEIPQWVAKLFPTYYTLNPIIELTMNNASWADIATDMYILIGLTAALIGVAGFLARRALDADASDFKVLPTLRRLLNQVILAMSRLP